MKKEKKTVLLVHPEAAQRFSVRKEEKNLPNKWVKIKRKKKKRVGYFGLALFVFKLLSQPLLPISYSFWLAELECSKPC